MLFEMGRTVNRETQSISRQEVTCPKCKGKGRAGLFGFSCKKCDGSGQLLQLMPPTDREPCTLCRGLGKAGGFMNEDLCACCRGSGLEPEPVKDNPCPSCSGLGFHIQSMARTLHIRNSCSDCRGTGQRAAAIHGKDLRECPNCEGYGYSLISGPKIACSYCSGEGWVPLKKKKSHTYLQA